MKGKIKMINLDLTEIVVQVIYLIFAALGVYLTHLARNKNKNQKLMELIALAVGAAEQLYKTGIITDRKAYVLQKLSESGVDINAPKVDLAIESEVNKLKSIVSNMPKDTIDGSGIGYGV